MAFSIVLRSKQKFSKLQTLCSGFIYNKEGISIRGAYSTKINEVVEFVDRAVSEGEQVLLFYAFRDEALWISEKLDKLKIRYCSHNDKKFFRKSGIIEMWM